MVFLPTCHNLYSNNNFISFYFANIMGKNCFLSLQNQINKLSVSSTLFIVNGLLKMKQPKYKQPWLLLNFL